MHDSRGRPILEVVALPIFGQSAAALMPDRRAAFQHRGQRQEAFNDPSDKKRENSIFVFKMTRKKAGRKSEVMTLTLVFYL